MSDLPGPEKQIDWAKLLGPELVRTKQPIRRTYSPDRLRPRHRIAVLLHESGWRPGDIARALGYTAARISVILNSSNEQLQQLRIQFASKVADNVRDVSVRFKLYANEMLDILVNHARQEGDKALSRLAARDILYMAGFTPVKKNLVLEARVPVEELKRLVGHIQEANEVALNSEQWRVRNPEEEVA